MSYSEVVAEHQRLSVLRVLVDSPRYAANDSLLCDQLGAYGLDASRDQLRGQLTWLAEQGLVRLEQLGASVYVATLTQRGLDVANGRASVPGVKRPTPKG